MVDINESVGNLLIENPARARAFESFGIDYCCGGKIALKEACRKKGLDIEDVISAINKQDLEVSDGDKNWSNESISSIIDHLESTHHEFMKREFPRLTFLVDKVSRVHGERHKELYDIRDTFYELKKDLEPHLMKEEKVLFPMSKALEAKVKNAADHCGGIENPIRVMEFEHETAGALLKKLRELTSDYTPPSDACNSYIAMITGLHDFEKDTHLHIHKENNILFPKLIDASKNL